MTTISQKQISNLAIFKLIINNGENVVKMPCIYHLIQVHQNENRALLNIKCKVNAINLDYA